MKRVVEISEGEIHLCVRNAQICLQEADRIKATIPIEDVSILLIDNLRVTYSHSTFVSIAKHGGAVVLCDESHMPNAIVMPTANHSLCAQRLREQIAMRKPLRNRLWQQLVRAKIKAQQGLLKSDSVAARRLREFERGVQSADRSNREAQAAKVYWANWLEHSEISEPVRSDFRRIARGGGVNSLLDYGYAIIRAAVARMLVSAGLTPALGLFHTNRSNSFCLADDLMEPLRPLVDRSVRELLESGHREINRVTKRELLSILYTEITVDEIAGPLTVSCQRYVNSFVQCMLGKRNGLAIPTTCI